MIRILALVLACAATPAGAAELRLVARTGGAAPGAGPFAEFDGFLDPTVDAAGRATFEALLQGTILGGGPNGVWSESGGTLARVAREGDLAPGLEASIVLDEFLDAWVDDAGSVVVHAEVAGPGVDEENDTGLWTWAPGGALALLAVEGAPAPGTPLGVTFTRFEDVVSRSGRSAFSASIAGPGVDPNAPLGVWSALEGPLELVMRLGDTTAGVPGFVYETLFSSGLTVGAAGELVYAASFDGGLQSGWWLRPPGAAEAPLLLSPLPAPGLVGAELLGIGIPLVAAGDRVAFRTSIVGLGPQPIAALYTGPADDPEQLARAGAAAPGAGGALFESFALLRLSEAGRVSFVATLDDASSGIWTDRDGALDAVMISYQEAPGTGGQASFLQPLQYGFNRRGDVVFRASLTGTVSGSNDSGLWAAPAGGGEVELLIREGDVLELVPGEPQTVALIDLRQNGGNADGRPSAFNDRGEVAVRLEFASGDQAIVVVPEPAGPAAAALAALAALARRRAP